MKKNREKIISGFTMIELMVAMTLFITVVGIATAGFIQALHTQRATAILLSANSNASSALEQMMREIRTGINFTQVTGSDIAFTNSNNELIVYGLDTVSSSITRQVGIGSPRSITASDVGVVNLNFLLFGTAVGDGYPPRVTILISITPLGITGLNIPLINMQTSVSARDTGE